MIREDLANNLELDIDTDSKIQFLAADGQTSTTLGQTSVFISPPDSKSRIILKSHVSSDLPVDFLIGMHTLYNSSIDFGEGKLRLPWDNQVLTIEFDCKKPQFNLAPAIAQNDLERVETFMNSEIKKLTDRSKKFRLFLRELETIDTNRAIDPNHVYFVEKITESEDLKSPEGTTILEQIKIGEHLSRNQRKAAQKLILEFADVFQVGSEISLFKNGNHKQMVIPLTSKRYSRDLKVPVIPVALYEQWSKQLKVWLDNGIVERQVNQVPYLGGFVPVKKKDGSYRFAYDARNLNSVIEDEHVMLPRTDTLAANLSGRKLYSSLDVASFYLNFGVHPDSRDLLSFNDPVTSTMYRFTRSVFGLKGSCQTSVTLMNEELSKINGFNEFLFGYVDDINLSTDTFEHMISLLRRLFLTLRSCAVKLKPAKCALFESEINIFGFTLNEKGMSISKSRSEAIRNTPFPKSKKNLVSHLASINYFRSLCPSQNSMAKFQSGFADIAKTTSKFVFTPKHERLWIEMHDMVSNMISRQRLLPTDTSVVLRVDASETFFGYCLSAKRLAGEVIIVAGSKMWSDSSRNWHITRKELIACLESLKILEWALINRHVTIVTDNAWAFFALKYPHKINLFEPSLISRKLLTLSLIDYDVLKATNDSKGFALADSLSRGKDQLVITPRNCDQLLTEYKQSRDQYPTLFSHFLKKTFQFCGLTLNTSMRDAKAFQDLVISIHTSEAYKVNKEIEEHFRLPLILRCHNLGHMGFSRINHVLSRFGISWPKKNDLIQQVLSQCDCAKFKSLNRPKINRDGTIEATRPFDILEIDCNSIGQFNPVHLLVCVCPFSKFVMAEKINGGLTSKNIIVKLFSIIARYCPQLQMCRMDNAQYFKSDNFQLPLQEANIKVSFGSRHGSRSLSNVERANRSINEQLRFRQLGDLNNSQFDIILQTVITSINCAPSVDMPFSPFEIVYGLYHSPFTESIGHNNVAWPKDMIIKGINDLQQLRALFHSSPNDDLDLYDVGDIVRIRANPKVGANKIRMLKFTEKLYIIVDKNKNRGTYKLCLYEDRNRSDPSFLFSHHRFVKIYKKSNDPILPTLKDLSDPKISKTTDTPAGNSKVIQSLGSPDASTQLKTPSKKGKNSKTNTDKPQNSTEKKLASSTTSPVVNSEVIRQSNLPKKSSKQNSSVKKSKNVVEDKKVDSQGVSTKPKYLTRFQKRKEETKCLLCLSEPHHPNCVYS